MSLFTHNTRQIRITPVVGFELSAEYVGEKKKKPTFFILLLPHWLMQYFGSLFPPRKKEIIS